MDVSVVIVNYNTPIELKDCLDSIFIQTKDVSFEVIVVDNASKQDALLCLKKEESRSRVIYLEKNIGFGRANNIGAQNAEGKYIFFLNSDTILLNNAIKIFFDRMEKEPADTGCLGTYLLDGNKNVGHSYGKFPSIGGCSYMFLFGPVLRRLGINRRYFDYEDDIVERDVDYITGAALFVRRNIGNKLGFFDPRYFLYYEESDMQKTYAMAGYKRKLILGPSIIHLSWRSTDAKTAGAGSLLPMQSHFIYLKKWNNSFYYFLYKVLFVLIRSLYLLLPKNREQNLYYIKAAFKKYPNP